MVSGLRSHLAITTGTVLLLVPEATLRGVSAEIGFFSFMHAPRYELHISENIAKNIIRGKSYDLVNMRIFF